MLYLCNMAIKKWIDKDEWDLDNAWTAWRKATIGYPSNSKKAMSHSSYKEVERILTLIKDKEDGKEMYK